jgi:hypothetical protein
MDTKNVQSINPIVELGVNAVTGFCGIMIEAGFESLANEAKQKQKTRAENLRKLILAGRRFRLEEMVSLLNHQVQTVDQIAVEIELPVVMVQNAVKRFFFF